MEEDLKEKTINDNPQSENSEYTEPTSILIKKYIVLVNEKVTQNGLNIVQTKQHIFTYDELKKFLEKNFEPGFSCQLIVQYFPLE